MIVEATITNLQPCENYFAKLAICSETPHRAIVTSSYGNIFRVTGPLCGEFTGHRWFPITKPVTRNFDVLFDLRLNKRLSKQSRRRWFETPSRSLWRDCNGNPVLYRLGPGAVVGFIHDTENVIDKYHKLMFDRFNAKQIKLSRVFHFVFHCNRNRNHMCSTLLVHNNINLQIWNHGHSNREPNDT